MTGEEVLAAETLQAGADCVRPLPPHASWPNHWGATCLADERTFSIENGTWTGEKDPLVECPVIRNTNFTDEGTLDLSDVAVIPIEHRQLAKKRLAWGDIIIERSGGGPKQPVGRVAFFGLSAVDSQYCFSNFTSRVRVLDKERMDPRFLHLYLLYFHQSGQTEPLQRRTTGIRNLAFADYKNSPVPLPPAAEQRAIACILRSVQDTIQARRRELELERERKAALMQRLFTYGAGGVGTPTKQIRFGEVPAHWRVQPLAECAYIQTGIAKGRKLDARRAVVRPYLRVANVQDGYLDLSEIKHIELLESEVDRYSLQPGDVLLTEGGDFDKLGRGFIWRNQVAGCVHQNHIFAVRADDTKLVGEFLAYLVQSPYGKGYFLSVAHRTTNLASINSTKLRALPALLPPLDEQRAIIGALDACDAHIDALDRETAVLDELFRALLEELMTGRLSGLPLVEIAAEQPIVEASATAEVPA